VLTSSLSEEALMSIATTASVEPLTPTIGAVVHGVDVGEPIGEGLASQLRSALADHLVVFVRRASVAPVSAAELQRLASVFGEIGEKPSYMVSAGEDTPDIHVVDYDGSLPRGSYADIWHSDVTCAPEPPHGALVTPLDIPECGGDTLWSSMLAAYEALSPKMQDFLDGLEAEHTVPSGYSYRTRNDAAIAGVLHPVVRKHPTTGRKALFVNEVFTQRIVGLDISESNRILDMLFRHVMAPEFQMRWRWRYGDVAIWDERWTMHYGVVDYRQRRRLTRAVLKDLRPVE
jgi:taurine dioxygenase